MNSEKQDCDVPNEPWATIFSLKPSENICHGITRSLFPDKKIPYRITKMQNRGAYGVVFMAKLTRAADPTSLPPTAAVKVQFVCPKRLRGERRDPGIRELCSAYGQRASLYETVQYELRMHRTVFNSIDIARASAAGASSILLPAIGKPLFSKRIIVGKKSRKKNPTIPPDGRRRLWVTVNEYVEGESLRQFLIDSKDAGTLTPVRFEAFCRSILASVKEFHELGFTHGDLHSGNILVNLKMAQQGKPWMYMIDFERTVSLADIHPQEAAVLAQRLTTKGHPLEGARDLFDMLKLWDLKLFCESAVGLAEGLGIGGGQDPEPWKQQQQQQGEGKEESADTITPAKAQFLRSASLVVRLLSAYLGRDVSGEDWAVTTAKTWTLKTLYFKRSVSGKSLPKSIASDVKNFDPQRMDALEKRKFFLTLRFIQGMRAR